MFFRDFFVLREGPAAIKKLSKCLKHRNILLIALFCPFFAYCVRTHTSAYSMGGGIFFPYLEIQKNRVVIST